MSYNNRNRLLKIVRVQEITLEHTQKGVTQEWVFENIIKPTFFIGKATYYNYLAYNAKAELKKLCTDNQTT